MATRVRNNLGLDATDKASPSRDELNDASEIRGAPDRVLVAFADSPFTPEPTDGILLVDATGGAVTIALYPLADSLGVPLVVFKVDSSGNAVTLDGDGTEPINGSTTKVLAAQYDSATLYPEASIPRWLVVAET